jgi:heme exporter protein D
MTGLVAGVTARSALSGAGAFLGKISPKVWLALGCAVALLLGLLWHHHEVDKTIATAKAEQKAADDKITQAAIAQIAKDDAQLAALSANIKAQVEYEDRLIAGDANALRVSGPGKARCPIIPASPGGHVAPAAKPDDAGPSLPPGDGQNLLAGVEWGWLTDRAQEHDQLLADEQAWRDWYSQIVKAWPKK